MTKIVASCENDLEEREPDHVHAARVTTIATNVGTTLGDLVRRVREAHPTVCQECLMRDVVQGVGTAFASMLAVHAADDQLELQFLLQDFHAALYIALADVEDKQEVLRAVPTGKATH